MNAGLYTATTLIDNLLISAHFQAPLRIGVSSVAWKCADINRLSINVVAVVWRSWTTSIIVQNVSKDTIGWSGLLSIWKLHSKFKPTLMSLYQFLCVLHFYSWYFAFLFTHYIR